MQGKERVNHTRKRAVIMKSKTMKSSATTVINWDIKRQTAGQKAEARKAKVWDETKARKPKWLL